MLRTGKLLWQRINTKSYAESLMQGRLLCRVRHMSSDAKSKDNNSNSTPKSIRNRQSIHDEVRKYDYLHYFCSGFYPQNSRRAYLAVRALNTETSHIKDSSSEPHIGLMRLQWWKESITALYAQQQQQEDHRQPQGQVAIGRDPISQELRIAIEEFNLSRTFITKLLNARIKEMELTPMRTMDELEIYAEDTSSSLVYLALQCLGINDHQADHAASHIGKAIGLVTLLRGTPFHLQQRQPSYLPIELTSKHNVVMEDVYQLAQGNVTKDSENVASTLTGLTEVAYEIASIAKIHLDHARELSGSLPQHAYIALLPGLMAEQYLTKLQKVHFDIFDPRIYTPPATDRFVLQVKLLYYYLRKQY